MVKRNFIPYLHLLMKKMISKITKRVFKEAIDFLLIRPILKYKKFNAADSIILFSEARGGSTWLMEMLRETLNVCINWEPLHVNSGVVPKENKLGWRPFIPKENIDDSYRTLFTNIHKFKIHSKWTRKYLTLKQLFRSKQVLVKYVRANLLVPYLLENFEYKYPPIFLLRHPIDTCLSHIRAFGDLENRSIESQISDFIYNDRLLEYKDYVSQLDTRLEKKIALWCLNNCSTINKLNEYNLHIVFYSDLVLSPKKELENILVKYNSGISTEKLTEGKLRKASSTDFNNEYNHTVEKQLHKNFEILDNSEKDKIQMIFDYFDFQLYTAYSPFPNKDTMLR